MITKAAEEHKEWIIRHRIEMFREMGWNDDDLRFTEQATREFLDESWDQAPTAFLAIEDDVVQGGCSVTFYKTFPSRHNPTGQDAYVLNMFVEPQFRKKGIATRLLKHILDICKSEGIGRVALHSAPMGIGIYESLGFEKVENYYRMIIRRK